MRWSGLFLVLAFVGGCGPTISEARMAVYPPRADNCELEFIQASGADMSPGGKWRVIGYVSVGGLGKVDPFSPKNRDLVRPRICQMGGVAVAIAIAGMTETPVSTGSTVTYAALRFAAEPVADTPTQTF